VSREILCETRVVPLSEDEQRILQQIEQQFYASDPELAGEIGNHSLYAHCLRRMRWATAVFILGLVVLVVALATATSFLVSFGGFVVMLGAALWFERSLRKMGRAGMAQLSTTLRAGGIRDYFGEAGDRMRGRTQAQDDADDDSGRS
jgi:hypothetical protein